MSSVKGEKAVESKNAALSKKLVKFLTSDLFQIDLDSTVFLARS